MELTRNVGWLGILLIGVCCASPYYRAKKPRQSDEVSSSTPSLPEVVSNQANYAFPEVDVEKKAADKIALVEPPRLYLEPKPPKPPLISLPDWANPTEAPPVLDTPPPALPPVIPVFVSKKTQSPPDTRLITEPVVRNQPLRELEPPRPKVKRHRVIDGDSLRMIALRYYGNEQRASEIFAANANVLRNPELLPVGQELVIPQP